MLRNDHATYLRDPHNAAALQSGARCGPHGFSFRFASTQVNIDGLSTQQFDALSRRFGALIEDTSPPTWSISVSARRADASSFVPIQTQGLEYRVALDHNQSKSVVSGINFIATVDRGSHVLSIASSADGEMWLGPFENSLRVAFACGLLDRGGIVFHSAGISHDTGGATIALGQSGAGKTTLCRMVAKANHGKVLSDELNALQCIDERWHVLALPFAGDFGQAPRIESPLPLKRVWLLRQGQANQLNAATRSSSFASMLGSAVYVNSDSIRRDALEETLERILQSASIFESTFTLDGAIVSEL